MSVQAPASSGFTVVPNAEQAKSMASWFITTFGAGIAGFVAGKGWVSAAQATSIISSPYFYEALVWAIVTLPTLVWGLYVHTKKYATEVVDAIPEVKGVVTDTSAAGLALARVIPSDTVVVAGSAAANSIAAVAPPKAG